MCRVIAVSNQKGGVGKTVSCVNLGIGLAQEGKKVLLIDADPQGSLTISLGYEEPDEMEYSLATLMMNIVNDEKLNIEKTILHHKEGVDLIPANIELSAIEVSLVNAMSRELILRSMVDRLREFYDYIIIDCMPSLGMMTINALACADSVLMRHMIRHTGGHMPIAMEESSNYKCSESHQSGGFFAVTKGKENAYVSVASIRVEEAMEDAGRVSEEFKPAQIKVIYEAAEADLNLEHYMNPKFSASHMKFIMEQEKAGKDVTWLPIGKILHRSIVEKPLTRDQIRRIKERMQRAEPKDSVIADLHEKKKEAARVPKKQGQQKEKGER